jgi:hypothetical protein
MTKSMFTLMVVVLAIFISAPAFAKDNETIEMELEMLNETQTDIKGILEEIKEQLANDGACPCYSLAQLNQVLEDFGPFLPDPGGEVAQPLCEPDTVARNDESFINNQTVRITRQDLCIKKMSTQELGNRTVSAHASTDGPTRCSLFAADSQDPGNPHEDFQTNLTITETEYQACRTIAIQWANQHGW